MNSWSLKHNTSYGGDSEQQTLYAYQFNSQTTRNHNLSNMQLSNICALPNNLRNKRLLISINVGGVLRMKGYHLSSSPPARNFNHFNDRNLLQKLGLNILLLSMQIIVYSHLYYTYIVRIYLFLVKLYEVISTQHKVRKH